MSSLENAHAAGLELLSLWKRDAAIVATLNAKLNVATTALAEAEKQRQASATELQSAQVECEVVKRQLSVTAAAVNASKSDLASIIAARDTVVEAALEKVASLETEMAMQKAATDNKPIAGGQGDDAALLAGVLRFQQTEAWIRDSENALRMAKSSQAQARDVEAAELRSRLIFAEAELARAQARIEFLQRELDGKSDQHQNGHDASMETMRQQLEMLTHSLEEVTKSKAESENRLTAFAGLLRDSNDKCAALLRQEIGAETNMCGKRPRAE